MPKKSFFSPLEPCKNDVFTNANKHKQRQVYTRRNLGEAAMDIPISEIQNRENVKKFDEIVKKYKEKLKKKLSP